MNSIYDNQTIKTEPIESNGSQFTIELIDVIKREEEEFENIFDAPNNCQAVGDGITAKSVIEREEEFTFDDSNESIQSIVKEEPRFADELPIEEVIDGDHVETDSINLKRKKISSKTTRKPNGKTRKGIHVDDRPFACEKCEWRFADRSNLNKHKRKHSGERPFACDKCDKSFSRKTHLIDHERLHTGNKPFSCDVCKANFLHKLSLNLHKLKHRGDKSFDCDQCKKKFLQKSHLDRHKRIHTGERPFNCDYKNCRAKFSDKSNLIQHKRIHGNENEKISHMKYKRKNATVVRRSQRSRGANKIVYTADSDDSE